MSGIFAPRLAALRAVLKAQGCAAMLVDHAELLAWITGYTVSETMYRAAIVPLEGEPLFVLRALDAPPCRAAVWFADVTGYADDEDPYAVVAEALRRRGLADGRLGVDARSYGFTEHTATRLRAALPAAAFVDVGPVSDRLRAVKDAHEIDLLRRASGIADRVMAELAREVKAGMRVRDAAAIAAAASLREGSDEGGPGPMLRARGDSEFLHAQGLGVVLGPGDVLHVELTPKVGNYSARLMRPILLGDCGDAERVTRRLTAIQARQIEAMVPGAPARDVDAVLRDAVLAEGLRPDYLNVTGYTLGLYGRTPRPSDFSLSFHPGSDWRLETGMVFHMYASAAGVAVSETVLVGSPPERLTRYGPGPIQLTA
ncbi:Xaa-Pro dipeptidase [Faunimonas pinastri]|uniref:Xaa-Pro dipeptidase n=1 Tax=Faunimonas pinastri TaxID=1855383 RepID=A0A1H9M1Y1_9HYPH|nr:Xaa-Pro peptidase family protein [Faunimonas pinastri]SER17487.1 Xaa-Pro dipeptidase [Faunimonas pinastri]